MFGDYEEETPLHWDPAKPWDTIIYDSAYGITQGYLGQWWTTRVEHPGGLQPAAARAFLAKAEGMPSSASSSSHETGWKKEKCKGKGQGQQYITNVALVARPPSPAAPCTAGQRMARSILRGPDVNGQVCWKFQQGNCTKGPHVCPTRPHPQGREDCRRRSEQGEQGPCHQDIP